MRNALSRARRRLSFANVTSTMALFVALGGTSYAAITLPSNSVGKSQIRTAAVGQSEVASEAIGSGELRSNAVRPPGDPDQRRWRFRDPAERDRQR